jgi:hypothetical protein
VEEHEDEVFKLDGMLVVKDKKNGSLFSLEVKDYVGKITPEKEEKMVSIGVFSVYD